MSDRARPLLRRLRSGERGSVTIFAAIGAIAFVGFGAITVDAAYVFNAKRMLQASSDAAALAGAMQLSSGTATQAVSTATTYSGASGNKNANANLTVTANPQAINCTGTTGATCTPNNSNPNGIVVNQTATVPLYFARIFGASSVSISTTAYALAAGGKSQPVDVMVIVDTTASMNTADTNCTIVGATRLDCALGGLRTLLQGFTPPSQQVALMLFPGLPTTAAASQEYDCSSTTPSSIALYNASPVYLAVALSSDFNTGGTLNTSSNLVKAARGGAAGCTAGVTAVGGAGTFYADAITAAQSYLAANGRSGVDKMIILLSDGDANSPSAPTPTNECQQAITAASNAQAAKTTVVTIAYGASTAMAPSSCTTDTAASRSACGTLLKMASTGSGSIAAPQWFYSDAAGGCISGAHSSTTDLSAIFGNIGSSVTGSRLIPSS